MLEQRKHVRLTEYDYSSNGAYFITICVKDRQCLLGKVVGDAVHGIPWVKLSEKGKVLNKILQNIDMAKAEVSISKYCIMPNHLHLILHIESDGTPKTASPTKSIVSKIINAIKGLLTKEIGFSLWQRSYYDHIIRNEKEYQKIWKYIDENPLKWDLDEYYIGDSRCE